MQEVLRELPERRRDEIFVALLSKALTINPRASSIADLHRALGDIEGLTLVSTFRGRASDEALIDRWTRLDGDPKAIARFLLRA
ncbi:hypothetical protein [Methylobacterium sp. 285MFTsu5.1]|uniref:hypothetical protein n=1 Tax=Methylobacterium sp. 285MFTsu5.1 TaxID=1172187 RepID=UPI00039C7E5A|nr:hypothetical protein [Methylobacterium sp. 285MFTsu5.1]